MSDHSNKEYPSTLFLFLFNLLLQFLTLHHFISNFLVGYHIKVSLKNFLVQLQYYNFDQVPQDNFCKKLIRQVGFKSFKINFIAVKQIKAVLLISLDLYYEVHLILDYHKNLLAMIVVGLFKTFQFRQIHANYFTLDYI